MPIKAGNPYREYCLPGGKHSFLVGAARGLGLGVNTVTIVHLVEGCQHRFILSSDHRNETSLYRPHCSAMSAAQGLLPSFELSGEIKSQQKEEGYYWWEVAGTRVKPAVTKC